MNGTKYPARGCGPEQIVGGFEFDVNGTSAVSTSTFKGSMKRYVTSVSYSATGLFTIVFTTDFTFPTRPTFMVDSTCENQTTLSFIAKQIGAYNTTTRTLIVGCFVPDFSGSHDYFKAVAPAVGSNAGDATIKLTISANNSGGL